MEILMSVQEPYRCCDHDSCSFVYLHQYGELEGRMAGDVVVCEHGATYAYVGGGEWDLVKLGAKAKAERLS